MTEQIKGRCLESSEKEVENGKGRGHRGGGRRNAEKKAHDLENTASSKGSQDVEDGGVVVDLPNVGSQHVIIITVLGFHLL